MPAISSYSSRKSRFLDRMNVLVPWQDIADKLLHVYPSSRRGRRPFPLVLMLRIHCLQLWFDLSDGAAEDALHDVVQGYLNYHSVPGNFPTMQKFRTHVTNLWRRALRRRSQKDDTTWTKANKLAAAWLPRVRVLHPWPVERFTARHPRQEPGA
ncbi:transposase [Klebsiella pneumoniae]|nr:transposase [Klebsiella pneumoniae]